MVLSAGVVEPFLFPLFPRLGNARYRGDCFSELLSKGRNCCVYLGFPAVDEEEVRQGFLFSMPDAARDGLVDHAGVVLIVEASNLVLTVG